MDSLREIELMHNAGNYFRRRIYLPAIAVFTRFMAFGQHTRVVSEHNYWITSVNCKNGMEEIPFIEIKVHLVPAYFIYAAASTDSKVWPVNHDNTGIIIFWRRICGCGCLEKSQVVQSCLPEFIL